MALCHGYPGDNKNMDLAEELALNGIVVLIFYYRGAWGSEGEYSFTALAPSTGDALKLLRGLPYVDASRVGLVSHSMGALPLTKIMSHDRSVKTGVLMAPVSDLKAWTTGPALDAMLPYFLKIAEGKLMGWNEERLRGDFKKAAVELNPVDSVRDVTAPLLVVVGSEDTLTVPKSCRLLYEAANKPKKWAIIKDADHNFTEHRGPLIKTVIEWLNAHL
ncbi:MAG: alpha/beta fold hydrolase [Candidatus Bathyarchaeota archaeon]